MSNSYRKSPIVSVTTNSSDKFYKKNLHKKERRKQKVLIKQKKFDLLNRDLFEFDDWDTMKDGKQYLSRKVNLRSMTEEEWLKYRKRLLRK